MKGKFFCFSPPVMLATFFIEIVFAVYVLWRYKLDPVGRLVVAILLCLAAFQIAEYNVCEGGWIDPMLASRLGYVAITLLPPLGLHLGYTLAGVKKRKLVWAAYASGAAFAAFFLLIGGALTGNACQGNYVIFQMAPGSVWLYSLYYYGWLIGGIALFRKFAQKQDRKTREALRWLAIGYLAFIVPTTTANFIDADTLHAIPSIMCGFAVIFATLLTTHVIRFRGQKR
jgi:hypothetical protein